MIIFEQMILNRCFLIRTVVMATESPPQGLNIEIKNEFVCFKKVVGIVFKCLYKKILLPNELERHQAGCLLLIANKMADRLSAVA